MRRGRAASCSCSRSGIGGSCTRWGSPPSQWCSGRREVSSTFARVSDRSVCRNSTSSRCSAAVQALGVPVGNPAMGSMLSQIHSTGTAARTCTTTFRRRVGVGDRGPVDAVGLQQRREVGADDVQHPGQRQVVLERGPQHRPGARAAGVVAARVAGGEAAGGGVPAGELGGGAGLARPGVGVQQHDPVGVEGPIQGEQGFVAAEKPHPRRPRHPTYGRAARSSASMRISGVPRGRG